MDKDKHIAKKQEDAARNKKKSSIPQDNYGSNYVDPAAKTRTQGKGDKYRNLPGWYSEEVTKRLEEIFGKKKKTK